MEQTCKICTKSTRTVYVCPRCNIQYCSVNCFRRPEHLRCSEEFYRNCVLEELKSLPEPSKAANSSLPTTSDLWRDASSVDVLEEKHLDEMLTSLGVDAKDDLFELLTGEEREEFLKIWEKYLRKNIGHQLIRPIIDDCNSASEAAKKMVTAIVHELRFDLDNITFWTDPVLRGELSNSLLVHAASVGASGKKRLVLAPTSLLTNKELTFTRLKHPRTGLLSLFHICSNGKIFELLKTGERYRCWFVDQSVVSDGSLLLLSPFHPLYLILPTLSTLKESTFMPYKDLVAELLDAAPQLHGNNDLEVSLAKVCHTKDLNGVAYYCYSEEKCLAWLCEQVEKFKSIFQRDKLLHSAILCNAASLSGYAVGTLCDYLSTGMEEKLKARLGIVSCSETADLNEAQGGPLEEPSENYFVGNKTYDLRDNRRVTKSQKRLALASKGTASLSSYFSK